MFDSVNLDSIKPPKLNLKRRKNFRVDEVKMEENNEDFGKELEIVTAVVKHWADSIVKVAVYHFPEREERFWFIKHKVELNQIEIAQKLFDQKCISIIDNLN